jgi:hypothetical protein
LPNPASLERSSASRVTAVAAMIASGSLSP